jgi:hypothetical protein
VYIDADPTWTAGGFTLAYRPERQGATDSRFRVWGRSIRKGLAPRLRSNGVERPVFLELPDPVSIRKNNVKPNHPTAWAKWHRKFPIPAPFFRVGVQTRALSTKHVGSLLIAWSVGFLSLLLVVRFAIYTVRQPRLGLSVLVISGAAGWLRYRHLSTLGDLAELTGNGLTVRDWVWFDSACYVGDAVRIYSNEATASLRRAVGMPAFSAYLFQWSGVYLQAPKLAFVALQSLVGPLLFFACLPAVRNKRLALLPLVAWAVFFRPMKYSYYYLTESLAMCLMIGWIAILYSRDPRVRDRQWLGVVVSSSILFGLASYTRDVVVTFLPAFLGMVAVFVGPRWRQRLLSVGCALGVVVALWGVTPTLFQNKHFSMSAFNTLPITPSHYRSPNRLPGPGSESVSPVTTKSSPRDLSSSFWSVAERISSEPSAYLGERYVAAKRFWDPELRWNQAGLNEDPAYRQGFLARLVERQLEHGALYGALVSVLIATAVFGLFFSLRWTALAGLFLYVTLFHVLFFPGFTSRPKAIFFPFIVLFASTGVFALIEGFVPWLREKIAARSVSTN